MAGTFAHGIIVLDICFYKYFFSRDYSIGTYFKERCMDISEMIPNHSPPKNGPAESDRRSEAVEQPQKYQNNSILSLSQIAAHFGKLKKPKLANKN